MRRLLSMCTSAMCFAPSRCSVDCNFAAANRISRLNVPSCGILCHVRYVLHCAVVVAFTQAHCMRALSASCTSRIQLCLVRNSVIQHTCR